MMLVEMKEGASVREISGVIRKAEALGLKPHPSRGARRTLIGLIGRVIPDDLEAVALLPGVIQVTPVNKAFKLVNREFRDEPTVIPLNGVSVGGEDFVIMAGPCSVESKEQTLSTARAVRASGASVLRGGAFKPRTSPYSFQGLGEEGLQILAAARAETGLKVVTEVTSPELAPLVGRYADILQIGARNMQNYALLEQVGAMRKPVLLKRGLMSTIEECLLAAEYILAGGNSQVMICERGIRTFETATRNTLDISAVAVIKSQSHLPVIVDPSHASGHREYIASMSKAAVAAGADGLIVEVHPDPAAALSDGKQSLTFEAFDELVKLLRPVAEAVGKRIRVEGLKKKRTA